MRNEWYCTDNDCMRYCKKVDDYQFKFIQAVWVDDWGYNPIEENVKDEYDNYTVCCGYIDINDYSERELEIYVSNYTYTLDSIKEIYGEDANEAIAECIFEDECLYESNSISGVVSWDDAKNIIENYINRNEE